jgi:hypothetical protein
VTGPDRAELLARIADEYMRTGHLPMAWHVDPAMTGLRVETWPPGVDVPYELRFTADWRGSTLVAARPLAGHRLQEERARQAALSLGPRDPGLLRRAAARIAAVFR